MRSAGPRAQGQALWAIPAAVCCGLCIVGLSACQGPSLLPRIRPDEELRPTRAQTLSGLRAAPARHGLSLAGLQDAGLLFVPAHKVEREQLQRIALDMARRRTTVTETPPPRTYARAVLDDALANAAAPGCEGPGREFRPQGLHGDPVALTKRLVSVLSGRKR